MTTEAAATGRVAILGQGYVGLPVSARAVAVGFDVVGFDIDAGRVAALARGESFIDDVGDDEVAVMLASGRFHPTADPADLAGFDVAVVSVPTPLRDGAPDLSPIEDAAELLAPFISGGSCVILESTTYPGTTEEVFIPRLERGSGLRAGADFAVGYSPERIDPSNETWNFRNTPKIVSGVDDASLDAVDRFYAALVDTTVRIGGVREAELTKLLENTFRHVNIALVNELAMYTHEVGIDVWDVIDAAATKPFGFMRFTPGPGVGGHCLPIDPSYLSWQVRQAVGRAFRFVELANDVNEHMPDYVVTRVARKLNTERKAVNGAKVLVLGLAYKKNSGDARESPAVAVVKRLVAAGAEVSAIDPLIVERQVPDGVTLVDLDAASLDAADVVLVLTDHDAFDWVAVAKVADKVLDMRNRLPGTGAEIL